MEQTGAGARVGLSVRSAGWKSSGRAALGRGHQQLTDACEAAIRRFDSNRCRWRVPCQAYVAYELSLESRQTDLQSWLVRGELEHYHSST